MIIKTTENAVYAYNNENKILVFISINDDSDDFFTVGGQFGKKLHELLLQKRELKEVLANDFTHQDELQEIFQRFILTLIEKIFCVPQLPVALFFIINHFPKKNVNILAAKISREILRSLKLMQINSLLRHTRATTATIVITLPPIQIVSSLAALRGAFTIGMFLGGALRFVHKRYKNQGSCTAYMAIPQ